MIGMIYSETGLPALVVELACHESRTLKELMKIRKLNMQEKAELIAGISDGLQAIHVSVNPSPDVKAVKFTFW